MNHRSRLNRRDALHMMLGYVTLWLAGFPELGAIAARASSRGALREALGSPLAARESAAAVGDAFLRRRPEEADAPALRRRLALPSCPVQELPAAIRLRLGASHREDFRAGRVCELRGWTLSETELRLCALLHLDGS